MDKLLAYLNSLPTPDQQAFAMRCDTSVGYLRKAISTKQKLGEGLCIKIERESNRQIVCEDLRSDVDWGFIRGTKKKAA